jgi:hypothetical protein
LLEVKIKVKCAAGCISQNLMQQAAEIKLIPLAQHLF